MPTQSLGFVSLAPRGDWDADTTYKRLDTVNYGGSSYIVLKALTGVIPTGDNVNYMLLASKGDNAFQVWLLQPGNEGKTYEDYEAWLRQPATDAGGRADEAANKAQGAADNANNAATTAQDAAQNANTAAEEAWTNAASAKNEADAARDATTKAQEATNSANSAAESANTAAEKANKAADSVDAKIGDIQTEIDKKVNIDGSSVMTGTLRINDNAAGNGLKVRLGKSYAGDTVVIALDDENDGSNCYVGISPNKITYYNGTRESVIWHAGNFDPSEKADKTEIPTSLPANGGNADSVGGYVPSYLMKRNSGTEIQADAILGTSQYGFGYDNKGFPVSGAFISFGGFSDDYTTQIIASYKNGDRMYFRTYDGDLKKWNTWQQLALMKDISPVGSMRFDQILDAQDTLIEPNQITRRVIDCHSKIGQGYRSRAAIGLTNKAFKFSPVVISAGLNDDGTEWADWIFNPDNGRIITPDGKTMAINEDVISAISWLSGTDYGPRLDVIRRGGTDPVSAIIPRASTTESGVVTTIAQAFAGRKSFNAGIDITAGGMSVNGGIAVDNGTITCTGDISAANGFYETSDVRLKQNITPIYLSRQQIRLYEFDKSGRHSYGVIAQEVERLYPSTVKENAEGHKVVNYIEVLTIKCAEQDERIEALECENTSLKERLERLEKLLLK